MRHLPKKMQQAFNDGITSFCRCWQIKRSDNTTLGLTDHDDDIHFNDTHYHANAGIRLSAMESRIGLAPHGLEARGILGNQHITEDDLRKGRYDNAICTVWLVDWKNINNRMQLVVGQFAQIQFQESQFKINLRTRGNNINQNIGRIYQHNCDAELGDKKCSVNLKNNKYQWQGKITKKQEDLIHIPKTTHQDGWFNEGNLILSDGRKFIIRHDKNNQNHRSIMLWQTVPKDITSGTNITIIAGCTKDFDTCRNKFQNAINFQGFPHLTNETALISAKPK